MEMWSKSDGGASDSLRLAGHRSLRELEPLWVKVGLTSLIAAMISRHSGSRRTPKSPKGVDMDYLAFLPGSLSRRA